MITFTIPLQLNSEGNLSGEHWTKKSKRHKNHKFLVGSYFDYHVKEIFLPCSIKLIRIAPREFDYDNLVFSFKWIRDCLADRILPGQAIGRADGDKRIQWSYAQEKGQPKEYAIRIEIDVL